ncbi:MAG: isoleucine--tRNA ligase [Gemmatimonadaceae bacterium]
MTVAGPVTARYQELPLDRSPNELEEELCTRWEHEKLMGRVDSARRDGGLGEFVFFEGPPTANGRPGIHHVFARTVKDLFCRYRVMKGYHVGRKAGWDTHGLPVEIEVEKQLGISGKQEIEAIGVERFNRLCRESVWKYKDDWERLSQRIGYWLDYSDPYITYSNQYVESVWWALATLHARNLLYRGHKILPYCPRCGTALSSHEVAQGYATVSDPSVYVALGIAETPDAAASSQRRILVWTTTPWTLVSNVALAVNPELEYVELRARAGDEPTLVLAESRAAAVLGEDYADRWTVARRLRGSDLAGMRYSRPLDWVDPGEGIRETIIAEESVSAGDGSGVVHMAPAFGADDYAAGKRHGLAFVQPVNGRGEFDEGIPVVGGKFVKSADAAIVEELKRRGVLFHAETIEHSYPHCWRCETPLIYYARQSWFVRTTAFREGMLARNSRVDWHPPEMGSGRFGEWLENNIDWALSRDRYWGTPLPLWVCDADNSHVDAVGGYEALSQRWGRPLPDDFDPHKPYIDSFSWPCSRCGGTMRRVTEVIDAWFDSGSMPFAQWHFPFENGELVERFYPADFIAEGTDQTRGWFYSLLAIATGLGDALPNNGSSQRSTGPNALAAPYRAVVVNDMVLDSEGAKMSKSRGNVVDPWSVIPRHGADAVRFFLVAASQVWIPRRFDEDGIRELAGRFLLTFKNVYTGMFARYANFGWEPSASDPAREDRPAIDRWMLSRLAVTEREVDGELERYEATLAARRIISFVVDDVSNWYVRLSRHRFYDLDGADNRAAFATLHEVLRVTCRLLAPFCPFVSDWIHRELTGRSVHLEPFNRSNSGAHVDVTLELGMSHVRALATLGRSAREAANVKVRQPLSRMVCVVPNYKAVDLEGVVPLLAGELNVKRVEFVESGDNLVRLEAKPNFRSLGKRFGKSTPLAAQAVASLPGAALSAFERGEPAIISVGGESHELLAEDFSVVRRAASDLVVREADGYLAAIDPTVTEALRDEGIAREVVSRIQRMRKDAGFAVSDRIRLYVGGSDLVEGALRAHQEYVAGEVLAVTVAIGGAVKESTDAVQEVELDGLHARIALTRVD